MLVVQDIPEDWKAEMCSLYFYLSAYLNSSI